MSELLKLPSLLSHFREHQEHDPGVGFGEFLAMHYGGDDKTRSDEDRDMQLPFKKIGQCSAFEYALPEQLTLVDPQGFQPARKKCHTTFPAALPDALPGLLFRPPCRESLS